MSWQCGTRWSQADWPRCSQHANGQRDTWSHHADGQGDTWSGHADGGWAASSQQDTGWHHANWHWPRDAATGLVTDLLEEGLDAERLGRFLDSTFARELVYTLVRGDAWDGIPDPFAAVAGAAENASGSPSPTPAAYEDGSAPGAARPAPNQTVAAACALTVSPAGTSPGGDESGGLAPFDPASMDTSSRAVEPLKALGPTCRQAGRALQPYARRCQGCEILFSSRRHEDKYCCGECRRTGGQRHSSGKPTCKREIRDTGM